MASPFLSLICGLSQLRIAAGAAVAAFCAGSTVFAEIVRFSLAFRAEVKQLLFQLSNLKERKFGDVDIMRSLDSLNSKSANARK